MICKHRAIEHNVMVSLCASVFQHALLEPISIRNVELSADDACKADLARHIVFAENRNSRTRIRRHQVFICEDKPTLLIVNPYTFSDTFSQISVSPD